jgi:hypothetical protein
MVFESGWKEGAPPFFNSPDTLAACLFAGLGVGLLKGRHNPQLLHHPQRIPYNPSLSNPSTRDPIDGDSREINPLTCT